MSDLKPGADPHVVYDFGSPREVITVGVDQQMVLCCLNCGDKYIAICPMSIGMAGAICKQYARDHRRCKKPKGESK